LLGIEEARDDGSRLVPFAGFALNLLLAGTRQAVIARAAIVLRNSPLGGDVPLLLELEQRGIERAVVDGKKIPTGLLDSACNAIPVQRAHAFQGFENHQSQCALPDVFAFAHDRSPIGNPYRLLPRFLLENNTNQCKRSPSP